MFYIQWRRLAKSINGIKKYMNERSGSSHCQFTSGISVVISRNMHPTNTRTMMPTLMLLLPVIRERYLGGLGLRELKEEEELALYEKYGSRLAICL
jgi:hypothetical protein